MRIRRTFRRQDEDGRILPLINIVFLLLIFFMVVGKLSAFDPFAVAPPVSRSQGIVEVHEGLVLVSRDGRAALDGEILADDALKSAIAVRIRENPSTSIRLKADERTDSVRVVRIMELLRDAGVRQVSLLTLEQVP